MLNPCIAMRHWHLPSRSFLSTRVVLVMSVVRSSRRTIETTVRFR